MSKETNFILEFEREEEYNKKSYLYHNKKINFYLKGN